MMDDWLERPAKPQDAAALMELAACLGPPHCLWLERLRNSPDFLPELTLTLWRGKEMQAHAMLARLPLYATRQRLHALIATPVMARPGTAAGTGGRMLARLLRTAAQAHFELLALPLEPDFLRHAGFVPPQAASKECGPFAAGIPFVLKGLGAHAEALAQNLSPHLVIYAHAESLL